MSDLRQSCAPRHKIQNRLKKLNVEDIKTLINLFAYYFFLNLTFFSPLFYLEICISDIYKSYICDASKGLILKKFF